MYLDLVILLNVCVNSFLLALTSNIVRQKTTIYRILAGGVLGALCLFILYWSGEIPFLWGFRIILPLLMIWVVFQPRCLEQFLLLFLVFFLSTFVLAGLLLSISILLEMPQFYLKKSYITASLDHFSFFIAGSGLYIVLRFVVNPLILQRLNFRLPSSTVPAEFVFQGKKKNLLAFFDTGNMLKEPFTGLPVAVATFATVKDILPEKICEMMCKSLELDWKNIEVMFNELDNPEAFALIPYHSLQGEGLMLAFKPEKVSIWNGSEQVSFNKRLFIGIKQENAEATEEVFEVLLPLELWRLVETQGC